MSWLRGRRRTLDIVNEVSEFDNYDKSNSDALNTGVYSVQYDNRCIVPDADDNTIIDDSNDKECFTEDNQEDNNNNNSIVYEDNGETNVIDVAFENEENDEINGDTSEVEEENNIDNVVTNDVTDENCDDVTPCDDVIVDPISNSENVDDEIDADVNTTQKLTEEQNDDVSIEEVFKRSGSCKPRFSLDSRMPGLIKSPNICRTSRLSESSSATEVNINPRPRKSISWAEDLETVHEFEKLKARRLSLANLFKKL